MKILVVHGPNLNLLGTREPDVYGRTTLQDINQQIMELSGELGLDTVIFQSNSEGAIVDALQNTPCDALIINPAAYTHTSVAIRDAIAAVGRPAIEVHISNIHKREEFRKTSYMAGVVTGQISGLGMEGYLLALRACRKILGR
jgi:3-dehydroquinate dehydratase-2